MGPRYCEAEECMELAEDHRTLCRAHRDRRSRGDMSSTPIRERPTGFRRVLEAALTLADADTDDEYRAAKEKMRRATKAWSGGK